MRGEPICEVRRGPRVESVHWGILAVVRNGRTVYSRGDPAEPVFVRSSIKPLQAWAALSTGAAEEFGLTPPEIAVMCGSHDGDADQVAAVRSILSKASLSEKNLLCGAHPPASREAADALVRSGRRFSAVHNNCSGKHAGMLAACRAAGWRVRNYVDPGHPLQRRIRQAISRFTGVAENRMAVAVDGCSAPTYALPLERLAVAFEAFFSPRADDRARRIQRAMQDHPSVVGRPCSRLIEAGRGQIFCKIGAEGVYGVALPEAGAAIAIKCLDGSFRPLLPVIHALCARMGLLRGRARRSVAELADGELLNWAGRPVGRLVPKV
jgi:L-asparaginase II